VRPRSSRRSTRGCAYAAHWGDRPLWIPSYPGSYQPSPSAEPKQTHLLWQFSDRQPYPGLPPGDGNLAHCSHDEFIKKCRGGKAPGPEPIAPTLTEASMCTVLKADGRLETFAEDLESGPAWHTWQTAPNAGWQGSESGKDTTWESLGTPGGN
jgi:hypothetical protein